MITFLSQPDYIQPVYSNLVYQFQSSAATDTSKYKYRYVVDVFTDEGFITTLKITPSTQGWGQTDLSPVLADYVSSKPATYTAETPIHQIAWGYIQDNMIVYSIRVGEEYATTPNGVVIGYDGFGNVGSPNVRGRVCYANAGVKEWFNGKSFPFYNYYLTGQTGQFPQFSSMFLTNSPRTRYIRETDNSTLAAFNYFGATDVNFDVVSQSKPVYSALFTFYDINDSVLSTGRTYNVDASGGTRPNCAWYYNWFDTPSNWAEQQVVYLGCGIPDIEQQHDIAVPSGTKYWKVELEGTTPPTPPTPEIETFSGCSCHEYEYYNPYDESPVTFTYLNCTGGTGQTIVSEMTIGNWCACQNTNVANVATERATDIGECDPCVCTTYEAINFQPTTENYSYIDCEGTLQTNSVVAFGSEEFCACEGLYTGATLSFSEVGACPLPFSADCRSYGVSYSASTPYSYTYTGCCGTEQTAIIPPSTSLILKINYPAPTPAGITATLLGSATPDPCPPPTPSSGITFSAGTAIIGRNVCDDSLMYFQYSGDPISLGVFFQYEETIFEFIEVGGGGFIDLEDPYIFETQASALSAFPCPVYSGGTCINTSVISEPFYFYLDEVCSRGDRNLYFMNKFGTWDYYNFREKEDVGYGIEKQVYQSAPLLYSEGWDQSSYYGWASRRNVWANNVAKSGILYTAPMPQAESIWLSQELFQSPSVYLIGDDGVLEPIVITNAEVVVPNYQINSSLYQISIEYKSAYDTIRQTQE